MKKYVWVCVLMMFCLSIATGCESKEDSFANTMIDTVYEGKGVAEDSEGKDITKQFMKDTKTYYDQKQYGKIKDYLKEHNVSLAKYSSGVTPGDTSDEDEE